MLTSTGRCTAACSAYGLDGRSSGDVGQVEFRLLLPNNREEPSANTRRGSEHRGSSKSHSLSIVSAARPCRRELTVTLPSRGVSQPMS